MASSSLNVPSQIKHDVFINFRGTDTRNKFFSHLCDALKRNGIDAFTDKGLKGGEEINDTLMRKISESQASVVIFSPNYADSRWCLDELVRIVQCKHNLGHEVLPVFLDVEPTQVRNQTGAFGDSFGRLVRNQKHVNKVEIWRCALEEVATLSGWDSSQISEAKIVEKIVNQIQTILGKMTSTDIDSSFVGIKHRLKDVESYLFSYEVNSLGIWGCSGIGKTALAKKLFEKHYTSFEGACVIENIGEKQRHELEHSWKDMLSQLSGEDKISQPPHVFSSDIRRKLHRKRVLIVLDDVNDYQQFEKLVGECGIYGPGSKIIVTSKDKQVLCYVCDKIYEVQKLSDDEAIQLLKSNILKQRQATPDHMELLKQAISYTEGLPLALIILGRNLYDKDIKYWRSELAKQSDIPDKKITKILRASYDELEHAEKEFFLDIACFFHQWNRTCVEDILDACKFHAVIGIERLLDKALINVNEWNEIQMHNLLQQMGRHIVTHDSEDPEDPTTKSRLWRWNDVYDILTKDIGTRKIEILSMELPEKQDLTLRRTAFARLIKLRVLSFRWSGSIESQIHLPEGLEYLPNSIRCLIWDRYPLANLPQEFHLEFLVELQLRRSSIKELWSSGVEPRLGNLKYIDLSDSFELIRVPELLGCSNLEGLDLSYCYSLEQIPMSIKHLHKLKVLDLSYCFRVTNLSELPESLLCLKLHYTGIEELPSSIQSLQNLVRVELTYCRRLNSLPSSFFESKNSAEIGHFQQQLSREKCLLNIFSSSNDICRSWKSLSYLFLDDSNLETVPTSINQLFHLKVLSLTNCKRLTLLPELPSGLETLFAENCTSLKSLHSLPQPGPCLHDRFAFDFTNCINLNMDATKNYMVEFEAVASFAYSNILQGQRPIIQTHYLFIPGSEVPKWFKYSGTGSTLTIKRRPKRRLHSCRLAFYVVLALKEHESKKISYITCECATKSGEKFMSFCIMLDVGTRKTIEKQHVLVWYDPEVISYYFTKAVFNFSVEKDDGFEIIECGVTSLEKSC